MKKIFLFISVIFIALNSIAERNVTILKNCKWYSFPEKPASITDFENGISSYISLEDSKFTQLIEGDFVFSTKVDLPDMQEGKLIISIELENTYFDVWIDSQKLENLLQDQIFLSEIDNHAVMKEILLSVKIKPNQKINKENLQFVLKNITITSLSGFVISWLSPHKDEYFGCPMLEVHVLNTLEKDVDGKLIARIFKPETNELIAENNNCAFSRNGTESVIDISFPNPLSPFVKGKYIALIEMVDKENNEEIVDQITVPVEFK